MVAAGDLYLARAGAAISIGVEIAEDLW